MENPAARNGRRGRGRPRAGDRTSPLIQVSIRLSESADLKVDQLVALRNSQRLPDEQPLSRTAVMEEAIADYMPVWEAEQRILGRSKTQPAQVQDDTTENIRRSA